MKRLAAWAALAPCLAVAQIHECRDANGRRVFSDVTCGPDAKAVQVKPAVVQPFVHPQESKRVEYYDVTGTTFAELRDQMRAQGVDGWAGTTWTHVKYEFTVRPGAEGCRVDSANAVFDARVRLPRWANRRAAPEEQQRAWDAWFPTLQRHEEGHVRIGRDAAARVERVLWDTPASASCPDVIARAKERAQAVLVDLRNQQEDYDLRTDHGRKQ
jgi:predicted secreted Zn-dependent protease